MQRYATKLESPTDWEVFYESALKQLSTLYQTEEITQIQYKTLSDFLVKLDKGIQYYFKLTVLVDKTCQLRSLSKQLEEFFNEQGKVNPPKEIFSIFSLLSFMLKTAQEELLNLKNLPPEILRSIANDLDRKATIRLASTCRDLFFSGAGLVISGIDKGFQELGTCLAIGCGHSNYGLAQGTLFGWSYNEAGQLGVGDENNRLGPAAFDLSSLNLAPDDRPKSISTCSNYSLLLTHEGRCFAWGQDFLGRISAGHFASFHEKSAPVECDLSLLSLHEDDEIESIFTELQRAFIYTKHGRLFGWGSNFNGELGLGDSEDRQDPVEFDVSRLQLAEDDRVRTVTLGSNRSFLLTEQGRGFAWGRNKFGQLGLGDTVDRNSPVEINLEYLNLAPQDKLASIVTTISPADEFNFSFLLTEQGRLFACGRNQGEWLILGERGSALPIEIDLSSLQLAPDDKVKIISSLGNFVLVLTEHGHGFAWGENSYGQLGLGDKRDRNTLKKIDFSGLGLATTDKINGLFTGLQNAFWISAEGRYFVCGRNDYARLGLGDEQDQTTLKEFSLPLARPLQKLTSILLDKDNLHQLADLAQSPKIYGRRCFRLLLSRLSSIDDVSTRIFYVGSLMTSPWYQSENLAEFLPLPALYQPLLDTIQKAPNSVTLEMTKVLSEFITRYQILAKETVNKQSQEDFMELLNQLSQGKIENHADMKDQFAKNVKFTRMTLFEATLSSPSTTEAKAGLPSCLDACQQWLNQIEKNPALLLPFKTAAELLLQGIQSSLSPQLQGLNCQD